MSVVPAGTNVAVTPVGVPNAPVAAAPMSVKQAMDVFHRRNKVVKPSAWKAFFGSFIPGPVKSGYKHSMAFLDQFPCCRGFWNKVPLVLEAVIDTYTTATDAIAGYSLAEGGVMDKTVGAFWSGARSLTKSLGVFGSSMAAIAFMPALVGGGLLGGVLGFAGAFVAPMVTRYVLDKMLDTHGHLSNSPNKPEPPLTQTSEDIVRTIDNSWKQHRFAPPSHNPWLDVQMPGGKQGAIFP